MGSEFQKVAVLGRRDDARVTEPMSVLITHLTKAGIEVLPEEQVARADLVIAVGGDGTMLYAGSLTRENDIPLLGINRGRLGFLADVTTDDMLSSVDHILAGNYTVESRLMLSAELQHANGEVVTAIAFNDVVLQRSETGRMVDVRDQRCRPVRQHALGRRLNCCNTDGLNGLCAELRWPDRRTAPRRYGSGAHLPTHVDGSAARHCLEPAHKDSPAGPGANSRGGRD